MMMILLFNCQTDRGQVARYLISAVLIGSIGGSEAAARREIMGEKKERKGSFAVIFPALPIIQSISFGTFPTLFLPRRNNHLCWYTDRYRRYVCVKSRDDDPGCHLRSVLD
ncbi:hypothetical protein BO70DRAFT_161400 [Aspergillus heteromorphus CBS 117.55]|uniref:Uncharacterized protein n=1 Tax=Aspergillus heteromorphus CBS 117.55 TaxID=1448321 RepID=A0A317WRM0_9EURO|nr:uncharacterized protein BO70DRAFT_161400 [Aspergillus heteromorphus CBS 117.55]PWY89103.1 hypothetical protein BO70DRAFT_161400 [Aspergillus heteromorphus CBS 117.55]